MDLLTLIAHNIFSFILIISVIVFIHEYGHYWVAKKCGVKIDAFSIGFGPELWGWNDKSGTRWKISAIPMGGYVKMFGDEGAASTPDNEKISTLTPEEEKVAFHTQPLWQKFLVVLAGPMANFLLAIAILAFFFVVYGRPETTSEIGKVLEESAAQELGLQQGDVIVSLDGESISRFRQIQDIVMLHPDMPLEIRYQRGDEIIESTITPKLSISQDAFGNEIEVGLIGIAPAQPKHAKLGVVESMGAAVVETYNLSKRTLQAVGQMIMGTRSAEQLSGILRIADYSGQSVEAGWRTVFWFMAVLSINLGLVNLFPIPMLDGGHLMFYVFEAIRGKPLSDAAQEYFFRGGFVVLIMLMLFATFNDLKHFGIF